MTSLRARTYGEFDPHTMRDALAGPGMDTRQWISFGLVEPRSEANDNDAVEFDEDLGPLVNVVLQPSGLPVRCRVGGDVAGNGEGEYFPFLEGDEVLVAVPEGDERAGCTIIRRLNNGIDKFPTQVAGQDTTTNTFAFRRLRTPYVLETAASYLIRSAATGAFFGISQDGRVTIGNADNAFLSLNPDLLGLQSGDGDLFVQVDLQNRAIVLQAEGTMLTLEDGASTLLTGGTLAIGTAGGQPVYHATSIESVVNLLFQVLLQLGAQNPGLMTGAAVAALATTVLNAALPLAGGVSGNIALFSSSITAALAAKVPDPTGLSPGVAAGGLLIG